MTADLRTLLESELGESYAIERELGGGGMSRVFVAVERALYRRVVIKVLSPELTAGLSARRFEREIRLAASLQHANIVPVLTAGQSQGVTHYTMPFVEGRSLRERLDEAEKLPLVEILGILRDVARALAYAHQRGVVHRDIKPENLLVSGEAVVVTDFGIAKAIAAAAKSESDSGEMGESTVTQIGTAVGTPAYMSPEQIAGDPEIDHRTDIYSFGCLAYELLAGEPPFSGRPIHAMLAAHLSDTPVPVGERNPDTPPALARMVMQCLEKEPQARVQSAREILRTLESVTTPATGLARTWQHLSRRQRAAGTTAVAVLLTLGAGLSLRTQLTESAPVSVAVIPFFNLSGDSADEYLADGMADGLATGLGKVPGLRVVSRSLSYRYKGLRDLAPDEIGRALSTGHVLQGSVRRDGGRIHVSAQLASSRDNSEIWADTYDRRADDAFAVQDDITAAIIAELRNRFHGIEPGAVATSGTTNPAAYDLYLRGRFLLQRRGAGVGQAVENFEQAIASDSSFAPAYASLALALELLPYFAEVGAGSVRERAVAAANRALDSDSTLAEAHTALAMAHQHAYEWDAAEASYRNAIALQSEEADVRIQYGRFLFYTGRLSAALTQFERARSLDATSAVASGWVGHLLVLNGQAQKGMTEIRRALEIDSTNPPSLVMAAEASLRGGSKEEARAYAERLWRSVPQWRVVAASLLAELGERERAHAFLQARERATSPLVHTERVVLFTGLGDTTGMLDELARATDAGEIWPTYFSLSEPRFDKVRDSPRFAEIVRRAGLDVGVFTSPGGGRPQ